MNLAYAAAPPPIDLQGDFISLTIQHFHSIVSDHYLRKEQYSALNPSTVSQETLTELLGKGQYYATDYFRVLKKFNQTPDFNITAKRLEMFVHSGETFHGIVPSGFKSVPDPYLPTKRKLFTYVIKPGVSPSDALDKMKDTLTIQDCDSSRMYAVALALKDWLLKEKFDLLFSRESPFPLQIGVLNCNPMKHLFNSVLLDGRKSMRKGDFGHFSTVDGYVSKHPVGAARGMNCVNIGPNQFLALGLDPKGVSDEDIEKELFTFYNADPIEEEFLKPEIWEYLYTKCFLRHREASKALIYSLRNKKISWEDFQTAPTRLAVKGFLAEGKFDRTVIRLDLNRVELLRKAPLNKVRAVFASFIE